MRCDEAHILISKQHYLNGCLFSETNNLVVLIKNYQGRKRLGEAILERAGGQRPFNVLPFTSMAHLEVSSIFLVDPFFPS